MILVKYFGQVAEQTQCTSETFDLPTAGLSELIQYLAQKYPLDLTSVRYAINYEMVTHTENITLSHDDEVAVLPPFAGG
ncbi:MAG TPA: MoaD/ThiS family protein [Membranihabitans sp.]|nr:MoaD/ThiS family protein [Membranihabitans sp.]